MHVGMSSLRTKVHLFNTNDDIGVYFSALHGFLTTEEMMSHIAQHIGVKDLILCKVMKLCFMHHCNCKPMKSTFRLARYEFNF